MNLLRPPRFSDVKIVLIARAAASSPDAAGVAADDEGAGVARPSSPVRGRFAAEDHDEQEEPAADGAGDPPRSERIGV
jgi:hypothetical protein